MKMTISMEVPDLSWLSSLLISLIITILMIKLISTLSKPPPPSLNLPPGPRKLPLIGNLHQLAWKGLLPQRSLAELARVYGPIMHLRVGEVPTVVVSSADMAREVLKSNDAACCNRPMLAMGKALLYDCSDIAMAPHGEYWRQVRKIATLELFTMKRVQSFRPIREQEVARLIHSLASQAGSVVNLSQTLFDLNFDITTRATFGKKGKHQEAFRPLVITITKALSGFSLVDLFPSLTLFSIRGIKRKQQKFIMQSNRILDPMIEERKLKMTHEKEKKNLIDVLLQFHKDSIKDAEFSLTTDNIKAIILDIFTAGSETSSALVEWAMSELIKNPRAMEKAQLEVRQSYQAKGVVDETELDNLKYLKLVIKETLRLHPPGPLLGPRETMEGCRFKCYDIPPKTRVIVNAWAIGRDPIYWTEPDKFIPERFEDLSIDYKGTHFEFIPFGAGRRSCPGMTLGVANAELPLAMLLYHFDWKLPHSQLQGLNMDESFGITSRRNKDLLVIPIKHF